MPIRSSSMGGTPFGTTANRPSSPQVGQTYYNGTLGYLEIYTDAGWIAATGANDFSLNITGPYTTVTFSQSYSAGSYSIVSFLTDTTVDIYAYATDGSLAGYTGSKAFTATQRFNKMVILGGSAGDVLQFSYKTTYPTSSTTSEVTAGPYITNITPSLMANQNDTITITGGNFASDVQVAFTGTGYSSTQAKTIVRSSSSQLIVTRPDNFPPSGSPYTVTITNPGVTSPIGSSVNISSNSITAGNSPVWVTSSSLPVFTRNSAYSTTLSATDSDGGSSVTYSLVSGSFATGLSLNSSTGVISGTPTSSINTSFTIRATDSGGNYLDRAFTMNNLAPVWVTASGAITGATKDSAYSYQLSVTDDNTVTYSLLSGSLPTGLTLSSSGLISGTPTVGSSGTPSSFSVRATDLAGSIADRSFTLYVLSSITQAFTTSGTWTNNTGQTISSVNVVLVAGGGSGAMYGTNVGCGGGGAGGVVTATLSNVAAGASYSYTIGAGGAAVTNSQGSATNGNNGTGSTFTGITTAVGGGYGGTNSTSGGSGGSGGGGSRGSNSSGTAGQGNGGSGGDGSQYVGGGGGGKSSAGGSLGGGSGASYYGYTVGGGGGGGYSSGGSGGAGGSGVGGNGGTTSNGTNAVANTGSGGGGSAALTSGSGSSGILILNYFG